MSEVRNRVVERKRMLAKEVHANPANWRTHPPTQVEVIDAAVKEIGQVGELYAYYSERNGGKLTLIDGHLRQSQFPDEEWDIAITDLNDEEADKLLLIRDPIAAMAETNDVALAGLLVDTSMDAAALRALVDSLARGIDPEVAETNGEKLAALEHDRMKDIELRVNEYYDGVLVFCKTTSDWNVLLDVLGLKEGRVKRSKIGLIRCIEASKLLALLKRDK